MSGKAERDGAASLEPEQAGALLAGLRAALEKHYLGQPEVVEQVLAALLACGHVLIEGAPGLGKTRLVRTLARLLGLRFGRVQCTPDLLPADVTGGEVLDEESGVRRFRFVPGPVFCNILLADEVNRATPRTQSALLESMEEGQVTAGGHSHALPRPFLVAATQNPIELEGTYPLPEAQLDRFLFKVEIGFPAPEDLVGILVLPAAEEAPDPVLDQAQVMALQELAASLPLPAGMADTMAEILRATHPAVEGAPSEVAEHVRWGASPRAGRAALAGARGLALLRGRLHVAPADLRDALLPALRHRLILRYEAQASGVRVEDIVDAILRRHPIR